MKTSTTFEGAMSKRAMAQVKALALQLKTTEAKAIEWAIKRCGLRIRIPSKISPE